ncbi:MAG: alpha-amylase [Oscillospiraceae bacterium]|jgi:alpha-amylase|nr:alpha-amylase [Oscillospiraceae bacterium]MCI8720022.1 alpha-amylase [Oscillospiraceae bacterium]
MTIQKRWSALLLAAVLLCSAMTGCSGGEKEDTSTALGIMRKYNKVQPKEIDDNYRSCYEVFVYSFYDSNGDGIGDLKGLTERLDYINDGDPSTDTDLGCTGIWLMPIMPSPSYHKYDVTDYMDIDPQYGTMEDFKAFLEAAHQRGIDVIIDFVMNHTSSDHPWFQEASGYLRGLEAGAEPDLAACPYVDYYNFSLEPSTCKLEGTEWYYEAPFWSGMPDLNLKSEAVRAELEEIVDFWLELGIDGFRLDAAKEFVSGATEANIEILTWFNDMVKSKKSDAFIVAEVWTDLSTYSQYYASGVSCFNFSFGNSDGVIPNTVKHIGNANASSYGKAIMKLQDALSAYDPDYIDSPFYTNHDMGRAAGHYFNEYSAYQTKMAQALNLLMSGSTFLYYGEELGMKGSGKDENKRAPMYWSDDAGYAGLCSGPADMEDFDMKFPSFEDQKADGDSIFWFVAQTIRLRNAYPAIARGTAVLEEALSNENVCVLRKTWGEEEVLLAFNISEAAQSVDLSGVTVSGGDPEIGGVLVTSAEEPVLEDGHLSMPMYSVVVLSHSK